MFSLGMSRKEAFRNLLFENVIISVLVLAIALAAGTVLSLFFFVIIIYGIDVQGVQWQFCLEAYQITTILYAIVVAVAFVMNAGKLMLDKIGTLLKAQYRAEKRGKIGAILCGLAPEYMNFHLVEWSFVRRHKKEWKLRYILASLIMAVSVMLTGVCVTLYPAFLQDAKSYSPYDMVYSEIYGMNQVPLQNVIHILEKNGIAVEKVIQLPYKEYLHKNNQVDENEQRYYELSSKVEKYRDAEKSGQFLLFLMAFVIGLMIVAEFLLIHSRIQAEREENSRAVCSLRLLGMTDKEIVRCLCYKNFLRFMPPLVVGTILSFLPSYYLNESYGMGTNGILTGIVFGVVLTVGMSIVVCWYSKREEVLS